MKQNPSLSLFLTMPLDTLEFLLKVQATDGSWGYSNTKVGILEPTAAVLLALRNNDQASQAVQKAADWILSFQNLDGGWGFCSQDRESGWQTAWAVFALSQLERGKEERNQGIQWLLNIEVMQLQDSELLAAGEKVAQIDFSIRGWPWLPGESSWVEPTALTMLAIRENSSKVDVHARIDEAVLYLRDRRCAGGGWNVGNPVMFDANLPARVTPTALALLALAKIDQNEITPGDLLSLRNEMIQDGGIMALAWGLLALHILGEEYAEARASLSSQQDSDGSWNGNPYLTAIAWMALEGGL